MHNSQRVLIVHTPPRDEFMRTLSHDYDSDASHDQNGYNRRRTMSLVGEDSPAQRGNGRRRVRSTVASREPSHSRTRPPLPRSPT